MPNSKATYFNVVKINLCMLEIRWFNINNNFRYKDFMFNVKMFTTIYLEHPRFTT